MKTILSSRRDHYLTTVSIFLVAVVLLAGMVGCTGADFNLTISSTKGGDVTEPRQATHDYPEDEVVDLVAEPWEGYQFVCWTGNVANTTAASTTITMDRDHSIIANFEVEIIEIRDWSGLNAIRYNLGTNYRLMDDLSSTTANYTELANSTANGGKGWDPIGTHSKPFRGSFDGNGHKIEDLFINRSDTFYVGLFGYVEGGVVKNISVVNATVAGSHYAGGLVGRSEGGNVSNSYSVGNVIGEDNVGGLIGRSEGGNVSNSYSIGNVIGEDNVGGLVGRSEGGNVSDSYSVGNVTGKNKVGGLVGWNQGVVERSYSQGSVDGTNQDVGGLVGYNEGGTVSSSNSTSNVSGDSHIGGLVGYNYEESMVNDSYSAGNVTGDAGVGGLVGFNHKSFVSNSHYNYDKVLINGENIITIGALFGEDFDQWLANGRSLNITERLSQEGLYYAVNNVTDFKELLAFGQNSSLRFRLADDLDLGNEPNFYIPYFAKDFDGNGHKISNLSFNSDFVYNVGLFGYLARNGQVRQVSVENVNITGANFVGGLVGASWEGDVSGSACAGSVSGCKYVGGLVGYNYREGEVTNSHSTGSVSGYEYVGGLVGDNEDTVEKCYSTGSVSGYEYVGGLVGRNQDTVNKSSSNSSVSGDDDVGGLVGQNQDTVKYSYSAGNVSGERRVGGLVGWNEDLVSNCYSIGNVIGDSRVGGLVGENDGKVNCSYSAGKVSDGEAVGGLVGRNDKSDKDVSSSFWNTETSGQDTSDGGTGKNTTQMKSFATFAREWEIIAVIDPDAPNTDQDWNIVDIASHPYDATYPFLSWQSELS